MAGFGTNQAAGGVLITGGSGLIGQAIAAELTRRGVRVVQAVRGGERAGSDSILWEPNAAQPFPEPAQIEGLDAAIHLSGANLAGRRWTSAYKREILSSRTVTTTALARGLAQLSRPPRVLISASATGIYGDRGAELLTENSAPGSGFLSETCKIWEASTQAAEAAGIHVAHSRFGMVLAPNGGALAKMLPLFRLGLGGRLGAGEQWMSWIALDDLVEAVLHVAGLNQAAAGQEHSEPLMGPVNCVAPEPVTNAEYTRTLGRVLHRPTPFAAPAFALRLGLGEMADEALLASCRAVPERLVAGGFRFRFPTIGTALAALLSS